MWANAQRDGRPAECRWRPLFNTAFWLTPTTRVPCSNPAKSRNLLKLAGVPQTNETISPARGPYYCSPYYGDLWRYCCLASFFSDCQCVPSLRRYGPTKLCDGAEMEIFCVLYFQRAACSTFQTCILNSH